MSKEEKTPWLDQISSLLDQKLDQKLKSWTPPSPPSSPESKSPKHQDFKDMVDCPDCYPKIEPLVLKKYAEGLKDKKTAQCVNCGLVVDLERDNCPGCGGEDARPT